MAGAVFVTSDGGAADSVDVEIGENGGRQSRIESALSELPAKASIAVGAVLKKGRDRHGKANWRLIPAEQHLDHALEHIYRHLGGDRSEIHLANAACRLMFALELSFRVP